jgi:cyclopropane fatty-acyl-phospholipid synthase-like methyltransferase
MEHYYHLADTIRLGRLKLSERGTTAPDHPVWESFARAMGALMTPCARGTAELVPLPADRPAKVLDIAASHGMYGIAFAQKYPGAHVVALDWQNVLPLAEESARKHGVADRFSTIAGDAFKVDLGWDYDVVLVPNFLHHFPIDECTTFLRRAHAALRPGGRVVIVEFVPNDDRVSPPGAATFSMVMLGSTPGGDAYTFAEYRQMLADAGFAEASWHPLPPTAQSVVLAQRPS